MKLTRVGNQCVAKCFCCDKPIASRPKWAYTADGQSVYVGPECCRKIKRAGAEGWQPPLGGPRMYDEQLVASGLIDVP